ncbi:MAG: mechanosensitive ion channel domain-containing protein [Spirochaetota bacterium]
MKDLLTLHISFLLAFEYILLGLVFLFSCYLVFKILQRLRKKNRFFHKIYQIYPSMILFFLLCFTILFGYWLLKDSPLYLFLLFLAIPIVLFAFFWGFLKDLGSGIVLRMENHLEAGLQIKLGSHLGEVKKLGLFSLSLIQSNGSLIRVPYHKIAKQIAVVFNQKKEITGYTFIVRIDRNISLIHLEKRIRETIYNFPWTCLGREPILREILVPGEKPQLEITVYTMGNLQCRVLEKKILALL